MARRRRMFGAGGAFNRNAPPVAINVQKPTVDVQALQQAYEWMPVDPLASMKMAADWYAASAMPAAGKPAPLLFNDALDAQREKMFELGRKAMSLGNSATMPGEKTAAWRQAIKMFERVWAAKHGLPLVDAAESAGAAVSPRVALAQSVLANFQSAFAVSGVRFRATLDGERDIDVKAVAIPVAEVMQMVARPPLATVLSEVDTVAKCLGLVLDGKGGGYIDNAVVAASLPGLMAGVAAWASSDKVLKPVGKVPATPGAKPQRAAGSGHRAQRVAPAGGVLPKDKGAAALALMRRAGGATVTEILAATGWTLGSAQSFVSNSRKKGIAIVASTSPSGEKTYSA